MALVLSGDSQGMWAAVECDAHGCYGHVTARPAQDAFTAYDLVCTVFDWAQDDGWRLTGQTYCPKHRDWPHERKRRRAKVGDGFDWVNVLKRQSGRS